MSEFHVNVVRVGEVTKHPNADALSCARVFDYNVIIRTGEFVEGDLAVYIPIDSIVPDTEQWRFLAPKDVEYDKVPQKYRRIKAKRLRGIFSQGMLARIPADKIQIKCQACVEFEALDATTLGLREASFRPLDCTCEVREVREGDDVCSLMQIEKWENTEEQRLATLGDCEKKPEGWDFVKYTDIEPLRRYSRVIEEGEVVVVTEKIHGANARFCHDGERLWVGSRQQIKKDAPGVLWWTVAHELGLSTKLAQFPKTIFFGEVFGKVQDLNYGIKTGAKLRVFDTFDVTLMKYNDWNVTQSMCEELELDIAPVLYVGPWKNDLKALAEGNSTLAPHVREGFVVKPVVERYDRSVGRVILKHVGEGYMLR